MNVITIATPSGDKINVTQRQYDQISSGSVRVRNWRGEEYCQVSCGLHSGFPTYSDAEMKTASAEIRK